MSNRFETIRKNSEKCFIVRDALTGAVESTSGKKYPVLISGMELAGDISANDLDYLKNAIKDRFGKVVITEECIFLIGEFYEIPLVKIYFTDEIVKKSFYKLIFSDQANDLCVEFKVMRISVKKLVEDKFGSRFGSEPEKTKGKEYSSHLFSVGGIWNLKEKVWQLRPYVNNEEFWK